MIDSRNFTAMGDQTNSEYDIHSQNPDRGDLSAAAATASGAGVSQQLSHPAMLVGEQYGDFSYAHQAGGGDSQRRQGFENINDGDEGDDVDGDYQYDERVDDADGRAEHSLYIDPQRLDQPLKLFVGQVPKNLTEDDLAFVFEPYGRILDLTVIRDRRSGNHRGCAFVTYQNGEDALKVANEMHGKYTFDGAPWPAQVRPAAGEIEEGADKEEFDGMIPNQVCPSILLFNCTHFLFLPFL
jgi:hypothetical protein